MSVQTLIVALIVLACALQAGWTLMPARARASAASVLLKLPLRLPAVVSARLRKAARGTGGGCGGCDSCGSAAPQAAGESRPITFHKRR